MSRAIEALSSARVMQFLHVILVCLATLGNVLTACASSLDDFMSLALAPSESSRVHSSQQFRMFLDGTKVLQRLLWRLRSCAELVLPRKAKVVDNEAGAEVGNEAVESTDSRTVALSKSRLSRT